LCCFDYLSLKNIFQHLDLSPLFSFAFQGALRHQKTSWVPCPPPDGLKWIMALPQRRNFFLVKCPGEEPPNPSSLATISDSLNRSRLVGSFWLSFPPSKSYLWRRRSLSSHPSSIIFPPSSLAPSVWMRLSHVAIFREKATPHYPHMSPLSPRAFPDRIYSFEAIRAATTAPDIRLRAETSTGRLSFAIFFLLAFCLLKTRYFSGYRFSRRGSALRLSVKVFALDPRISFPLQIFELYSRSGQAVKNLDWESHFRSSPRPLRRFSDLSGSASIFFPFFFEEAPPPLLLSRGESQKTPIGEEIPSM